MCCDSLFNRLIENFVVLPFSGAATGCIAILKQEGFPSVHPIMIVSTKKSDDEITNTMFHVHYISRYLVGVQDDARPPSEVTQFYPNYFVIQRQSARFAILTDEFVVFCQNDRQAFRMDTGRTCFAAYEVT